MACPAVCLNRKNAANLYALMWKCEPTQLRVFDLHIEGNIEADGWADLARALSLYLNPESDWFTVNATREAMKEARIEDLKAVWDSLPVSWDPAETVLPLFCWVVDEKLRAQGRAEYLYKVRGEEEEGWNALLKVLGKFEVEYVK